MATGEGSSPGNDDDYEEYEEIEVEEEVEGEEEEDEEAEEEPAGEAATRAEVLNSNGGGAASNANGSTPQGKLFVGGITWETSEETFAEHFRKYGQLIDSVIMRDKHTQNPRGFGFVTFADPSVVEAVLKAEHVLDGKTVEVKRTTVPKDVPAIPSKVGSKTKRVFVGGLPPHLSEDEFRDYFAFYGKVVDHQIMIDHSTGRSRGFGFVTFENEETVDEIMTEEKIHEFGGKQVELKRAVPKTAGSDQKTGRAAAPGPVGGGVYAAYGGGSFGYGGAYGYGNIAGAYGRGYGFPAAGYGYGMGLHPAYAGSMYGYGAGTGYGAGGGYGAYQATDQSGGRYGGRYHPYGR